MTEITKTEIGRYSRQLMLAEVGFKGQQKLKDAKVLAIGAGGLGCPCLQYLAAAGVGTIGIVDFDKIELHNLQRQILFTTDDIGKAKAEIAAERLKSLNPEIAYQVFCGKIEESNAERIISQFDIIVDGSDNFSTRYLVNDTCVQLNKTLVYGSVLKFEAQLAVFNYKGGKQLRDIYPEPPNPEDVPSCDANGIVGTVPGILGVYMANAVIQLILGSYLGEHLLLFNFEDLSMMKLKM
ncbi:thiamine biosynthesis protein ThiF [Marivirga lumbricoides]|uniref:Thiamine biosynthesis protein ThiF n=1 Tax=Marivirga lumbricoides TaxID=1046115 RepID=A0ABQ1MYE9_9BACT|nr:thiamine biosynthesis protein ThiF [Marivirga lumbricoides]